MTSPVVTTVRVLRRAMSGLHVNNMLGGCNTVCSLSRGVFTRSRRKSNQVVARRGSGPRSIVE